MLLVVFMYYSLGDSVCAFQVLHIHGENLEWPNVWVWLGQPHNLDPCLPTKGFSSALSSMILILATGFSLFPLQIYNFRNSPIPNLWH